VTVIVFDLMLYKDKKTLYEMNIYIVYVDFYSLKKKRKKRWIKIRINQTSRFKLSNEKIFVMFTRKQLE